MFNKYYKTEIKSGIRVNTPYLQSHMPLYKNRKSFTSFIEANKFIREEISKFNLKLSDFDTNNVNEFEGIWQFTHKVNSTDESGNPQTKYYEISIFREVIKDSEM